MKDPAFLFYSKDFYEGTRLMMPDERACFIDLLIYQHQHGLIPIDLKRVVMYCNGISIATLEATLEAKFKLCDKGWYNERLLQVTEDRKSFAGKQSINGIVGQFYKKAKAILKPKEYLKLKELLVNQSNNKIFEVIKDKVIDKAMLEAMLKHLAIVNGNEIEDVNKDEIVIKKEESKIEILTDAQLVIQHLNEIANRQFDIKTEIYLKNINARLKDGFEVDELFEIIEMKTMQWCNDDKMKQYLTPDTLFNNEKCIKYREQLRQAKLNPQQFKNSINANKPNTSQYTNGRTPFDGISQQ